MSSVVRKVYKESHDMYQMNHNVTLLKESLELIANQIKDAMAGKTKVVTHVVNDFDTIRSISVKYYGNIDLWRKLAKYNNVSTTLVTGTVLTIPSKEMLNGL